MINVCSIVTYDYIDRALAMFASMHEQQPAFLHLLVVNHQGQLGIGLQNVKIYTLDTLQRYPRGREVRQIVARHGMPVKERPANIGPFDYLRWSLKAVFANILLEECEQLVYCDCDLYFYNDFQFLLDETKECSIAITPHWRTIRHTINQEWRMNYEHGLYNGGFFITTPKGKDLLTWWSDCCLAECSATTKSGYVDQRYLDAASLYFEGVHVITHKGCNVAAWNQAYLQRETVNGEVLVAGHPIIFVHYSPGTCTAIMEGADPYLTTHYEQYERACMQARDFLKDRNYPTISQTTVNPNVI